jgi:hypothetical protein
MSRDRVALRLIVLASLASLGAAGCGVWDGLFGDTKSAQHGTACTSRDEQYLAGLLSTPVSCNASNADTKCNAAKGAFCNLDRGVCDWNCITDSDCVSQGKGQFCLCNGTCSNTDPPDSGAVSSNPACNRQPALLRSIQATDAGTDALARACEFNDECPNGSYCNKSTGACQFSCMSNQDCTGGNVCDCYGKCVDPAANPATTPKSNLPDLSVSPSSVVVPRPNPLPMTPTWGTISERQFNIVLSTSVVSVPDGGASDGGTPVSGPSATVELTAGPGLQVRCGGAYVDKCSVGPSWNYAREQDSWVAKVTVTAKPLAVLAPNPPQESWFFTARSAEQAGPPVTVTIGYVDATAGVTGAWTDVDIANESAFTTATTGRFVGTMEVNTPSGQLIKTPVVAVRESGSPFLSVLDREDLLFLPLRLKTGTTQPDVLFVVDPVDDTTNDGLRTPLANAQKHTGTGELIIAMNVGGQMAQSSSLWTLNLRPAAAKEPGLCSAVTDCAEKQVCDAGLCRRSWSGIPVGGWSTPYQAYITNLSSPFRPNDDPDHVRCKLPTHVNLGIEFSNVAMTPSGDLYCSGLSTPTAPTVVPYNGIVAFNPPNRAASTIYDACMGELTEPFAFQPDPAGGSPAEKYGPGFFDETGGTFGCIAPGPYFFSLTRYKEMAANAANTAGVRDQARKEFIRMIGQWLELHAFLAREGREEMTHHDTYADGDVIPDNTPTDTPLGMEDLLLLLEKSWTPVFAGSVDIAGYAPALLREPDNRPAHGYTGGLVESHEAPNGIAPLVADALTAQFAVLEQHLNIVSRAVYADAGSEGVATRAQLALDRYGRYMRIAIEAEMFLQRLVNASSNPTTGKLDAPWAARYTQARQEFHSVRLRVIAAATRIRTRGNPLGIEERDLPLFFGDVAGANSRYFASSDYLLDRWAIPAVASAQGALTAAREAWITQKKQAVADDVAVADRERRLEGVRGTYGEAIIKACGAASVLVPQVPGPTTCMFNFECNPTYACLFHPSSGTNRCLKPLETSPQNVFDRLQEAGVSQTEFVRNCYTDQACVQSVATKRKCPGGPIEELTSDAVKMAFCRLMKREMGYPPKLSRKCATETCVGTTVEPDYIRKLGFTDFGENGNDHPAQSGLSCFIGQPVGGKKFVYSAAYPTATFNTTLGVFHTSQDGCKIDFCDVYRNWDLLNDTAVGPEADRITLECMKELNLARDLKVPHYPKDGDGKCFRGTLGELQNAIRGAALDVELARDDLVVLEGDIKAQEAHCKLIDANNMTVIRAWKELQEVKSTIHAISIGVDIVSTVAAAAGGGAPSGNLMSTAFGAVLDDANSKFELVQLAVAQSEKLAACWMSADNLSRRLVGTTMRIKRRTIDLETSLVEFNNLYAETTSRISEGQAAVGREERRPTGTFAHHFWFDEKVERFKREFEWARRLVFLAMRAEEYEFQQSFPYRKEILNANNPDQLELVIRNLQTEQAGRTIGRKRPEERAVVLSVRDDIMMIDDRTKADDGERQWSPALRFRERLWDSRYQVRDRAGNWIGQGVPFTVGVLPDLKNRCGERLWRVNATIQGDGLSSREPGASVQILKRNTFSSQWCADRSDGSPLQTSSITPSTQLFRTGSPGDSGGEVRQYSGAAIYPWFNVRRSEFFKEAYRDGSSEELAGRGLYGDYVVLFPKEMLDKGFPLDKVEDILLRFDYLSVDNLPSLAGAEKQRPRLPALPVQQ